MAAPRRQTREQSLARVVLVAGLLSAAALVWVATSILEPAGPAGRAALARLTGEVVDAVRSEWERFLAGAAPGRLALETFRWESDGNVDGGTGGSGDPVTPPVEFFDRVRAPLSAAAALLAESERLEVRDGNLSDALDYAQDACAKSPDAALTAEARLRVLQLAAKLGRLDLVRSQWAAAQAELAGHEQRQGIPYLLLCAFVVGSALPEAERAELLSPVVEAWVDGRLRVFADSVELVEEDGTARVLEDDRRRLLRERLALLVPGEAERLATADARRRRAVVGRALAGVPRGVDARWTLRPVGEALFLVRGRGPTEGFFTSRAALLDAFGQSWDLPAGCVLEFGQGLFVGVESDDGTASGPGDIVRAGEILADGVLHYDLRMADPEAVMSAESARVRTTRVALLVAAAFSAFAAFVSWRALHRQARLTRLKNRFIASVSHELRTPVASILLMAENLESGAVAGAEISARYHGLIRQEALRLRSLVNDVLDFSRLEHGEATRVRCTLVPLRPFVDELGQELTQRAQAAGAGCALECDAFPEQAEVLMDAEAVRRGMLNLLDNALKHADGTGLSVRFGVDEPRHELVFGVADRGPGIPAARREAVLQPFERLDATGDGAGLGLAIVRAIAEAHEGRLVLRGRSEGPGAVFELRLPWDGDGAGGGNGNGHGHGNGNGSGDGDGDGSGSRHPAGGAP